MRVILLDKAILRSILNNQDKQIKLVLATIVRTDGATPRKPGTQMLIMENSQIIGTIGGGSVEKIVCQRAVVLMTVDSQVQVEIQHLKINREPGNDELPTCGGDLDVLLELIQDYDFWQLASDLQINSKAAALITDLFAPYRKHIVNSEGKLLGGSHTNFECFAERLQNICTNKQAEVLTLREQSWFGEPILKRERLLILGAGHVAREVANFAKRLDFEITVIDNRVDFAQPEFFPGTYEVLYRDFAKGIKNYQPNEDTYIVITTWNHKADEECVKEVLKYESKYVGMLGSIPKAAAIVKKLQKEGYSKQNTARLRAPIGLNIGAQTPSEIAISILAEIIFVRRKTKI